MINMKVIFFVLLGFIGPLTRAEDMYVDLAVIVKNIKSESGKIRIALVENENDFPEAVTTSFKEVVSAKKGDVSYTFKKLKPGKYAVSAFQDLNSNEKLDTNFFGIPSEPYGVSGNPKSGKPKFQDCVVDVKNGLTLDIELKN